MTKRVFNFSAGPATLPVPVLEKAREDLLSFEGSGIGVMELSHRSKAYERINERTEARLRQLLSIGDDYAVLFIPGGGTLQFAMIPMNFLPQGEVADYLITGHWAHQAYDEGKKLGEMHIAATSEDRNHCYIPTKLQLSPRSAYVHFTSNNTIYGTQFQTEPAVENRPLMCDASSDLLHKPIDVSKYGLIYAGAQKNLGPAGVTVVIVRKDLLERTPKNLPAMLDYNVHLKAKSAFNTPPTFPIYVVGEMFDWVLKQGGVAAMERKNREKAAMVYKVIDENSSFYHGHAEQSCRSLMNITFRIADEKLAPTFLKEAEQHDLFELKGHRNVGGIRASMYNAFPKEGAEALAKFMRDFAKRNS